MSLQTPLTKSTPAWMVVKSLDGPGFITVDDNVRSAVEGLKEYLLKKSEDEHNKSIAYGEGTSSDFWDAKHIATFEAMECVDMWFPVFVEDSHSHGSSENGVHVKESSHSVSGATTKIGCAATESVAFMPRTEPTLNKSGTGQAEGKTSPGRRLTVQPSLSQPSMPKTETQAKNDGLLSEGVMQHGVPTGELKTESTSANGKDNSPKHAPCKGCQAHTIGCCPNCGCVCECHKKEGEEK